MQFFLEISVEAVKTRIGTGVLLRHQDTVT
jgi:hypothetical protein